MRREERGDGRGEERRAGALKLWLAVPLGVVAATAVALGAAVFAAGPATAAGSNGQTSQAAPAAQPSGVPAASAPDATQPTPTPSSGPPPPKNLQVLPRDIPRSELIDVMRGFTSALSVRCDHCHVAGEDPDDLSTFDFASDAKEDKVTARRMMQMVKTINEQLLPPPAEGHAVRRVACVTCHNGKLRPGTLEDELDAALKTGGIAAAEARYRELHAQYYGRSAYDFGVDSLLRMARRLGRERRFAEAEALLRLDLERYPGTTNVLLALAEVQAAQGNDAGAIASLQQVLAADPQHEGAKRRLQELQAAPTPSPTPAPPRP